MGLHKTAGSAIGGSRAWFTTAAKSSARLARLSSARLHDPRPAHGAEHHHAACSWHLGSAAGSPHCQFCLGLAIAYADS